MSFRKVGFVVAALCMCILANDAMAQPGGGGRGGFGGGRGGFGGGMGGVTGLLRSEGVQKFLDLSEDQIEEIQAIQADMMNGFREAFRGGDRENIREKMQEMIEDSTEEIKKVMVGSQWKKLEQLSGQQGFMGGGARVINASARLLTSRLELDEEEAEEIEEKFGKIKDKRVKELNEELIDELAKLLPSDARKKFKDVFDGGIVEIDFGRPQFGGRGGQGGRGGRGGQGGRGGRPQGDDF